MAAHIAIGALRYFMLKFTRNSVIAFDFQEALSFEGETGPYVQYAAVRARNILRKLAERGQALPDFSKVDAAGFGRQWQQEDFWQMLLAASKADRRHRTRGRFRRARARCPLRVPARAGVQQFLSRVSRCSRKRTRRSERFCSG